VAGLTLDSGALIGFERNDRRVLAHLKAELLAGSDITVSAVVVAEVWRGGGRSARVARLLASVIIDPVGEALARTAGEALARVAGAGTIDALVMASAAERGDRVLTADFEDLERLRAFFPGVKVLGI